MAKYRKKPIIVNAEPYREGMEDGSVYQIKNEFGETLVFPNAHEGLKTYLVWTGLFEKVEERVIPYIKTSEGNRIIAPTDYIITGLEIEGWRVACGKNKFEALYELVEE